MSYAKCDFPLVVGDDELIEFVADVSATEVFDFTGSVIEFVATWVNAKGKTQRMFKSSEGSTPAITLSNASPQSGGGPAKLGKVSIALTEADTTSFVNTPTYLVRRVIGTDRKTILMGSLKMSGFV